MKSIKERYESDTDRYKRIIDAALLDDLITITCHPNLYKDLYKQYFEPSYPSGNNELRNVLNILVEPRNRLSHANPISHRQAEQIICYSHTL